MMVRSDNLLLAVTWQTASVFLVSVELYLKCIEEHVKHVLHSLTLFSNSILKLKLKNCQYITTDTVDYLRRVVCMPQELQMFFAHKECSPITGVTNMNHGTRIFTGLVIRLLIVRDELCTHSRVAERAAADGLAVHIQIAH